MSKSGMISCFVSARVISSRLPPRTLCRAIYGTKELTQKKNLLVLFETYRLNSSRVIARWLDSLTESFSSFCPPADNSDESDITELSRRRRFFRRASSSCIVTRSRGSYFVRPLFLNASNNKISQII